MQANIADNVIDLLFPRRCPVCGEILSHPKDSGYICPDCRGELSYVQPPFCMQCGKHVEEEEQEYCQDCKGHQRSFVRGFPVFVYDGAVKDSVMAFKYKNRREYASFYAGEMMDRYGEILRSLQVDAVVPVPVHKSRYRSRGYNQAEVLARELGHLLNVPCRSDILVRYHKTHVQKELDYRQREKNLENAFKRVQNGVKLDKVLMVDDIYTTGATMEACASVLKKTGVKKVYYTSICIGTDR